jgi:hypothetical protein
MPTLTPLQVAASAYAGGFRGNEIQEAVQVAYAESSWNTDAGPNSTCNCRGLWQINLDAHKNMPSLIPNFNVTDPVDNALAAKKIYNKAGGWCAKGKPPNCNPWAGYGTARYKQAYGQAHMALAQLRQRFQGHKESDVVKEILAGVTSKTGLSAGLQVPEEITGAVGAVTNFIPGVKEIGSFFSALVDADTWIRVAEVALGVLLIAVGLATLAPTSALVRKTPVGRIAKAIT